MMNIGSCSEESTNRGASTVEPGDTRRPGAFRARALLELFVTLCLTCGAAHAQQPKPPQLLAGGGSTPVAPPIDNPETSQPPRGKILFQDQFSAIPLAATFSNVSAWIRGLACGTHFGTSECNVRIAHATPLRPGGGNYLHVYATHHGSDVYRTELSYSGTPYKEPRVSVGGGDYTGGEYWYGYNVCVDKYGYSSGTHPAAPGIFLSQWHADEQAYDRDPRWGISLTETKLAIYAEHWDEPAGVGRGSGGGSRASAGQDMLETLWTGKTPGHCWPIIMRVKWDTRTRAKGGTGFMYVYTDSSGTPTFSVTNRQTDHAPPEGDIYDPFFKIGGYLSAWRGNGDDGLQWEARYDNVTIMDSTGSWAAMYQAITAP
ncbi:MAG: hypothetical protein ABI640_02240 [Gammaproteobacteria bacterium]